MICLRQNHWTACIDLFPFLLKFSKKIEEKTESILELLEDYGTVPESLKQKIHEEKDMETLKKWHKLAARTSSIEEFEEKMK